MIYRVTNKASGVIFGDYDAAGKLDALDVMARDAGYRDYVDSCIQTGRYVHEAIAELSIVEVTP